MLASFLRRNVDVFAWKPTDMPGVSRELIEHSLNVSPTAKPIKQKLRRFAPDYYSGYHQISLKEKDQLKTSFITPFGAYYYTTMSFGLKNARATYQRAIQMCLD